MSVVVIGMEMPSDVLTCPLNNIGMCRATGKGPSNCWECSGEKGSVPDWCPLRPLPEKHGKLIDSTVFETFVQNLWEQNGIRNESWVTFQEWIRDKTIIEAEGGSDE